MAELSRDWLEGVVGILETLNQGVIINDDCNHIVYANGHFLQMIGAPASELIGTKVTDLFSPEDRPALVKEIERRRREGNNLFEFFLPHRDGSRLPVVITAQQLEDPDGAIFVIVTLTNISAQKRAETALREANVQLEQRHREIEEDLLLAARVQQSLAPGTWSGAELLSKPFTSRCAPSAETSVLSRLAPIIST